MFLNFTGMSLPDGFRCAHPLAAVFRTVVVTFEKTTFYASVDWFANNALSRILTTTLFRPIKR
jgi:hypothetical protein